MHPSPPFLTAVAYRGQPEGGKKAHLPEAKLLKKPPKPALAKRGNGLFRSYFDKHFRKGKADAEYDEEDEYTEEEDEDEDVEVDVDIGGKVEKWPGENDGNNL